MDNELAIGDLENKSKCTEFELSSFDINEDLAEYEGSWQVMAELQYRVIVLKDGYSFMSGDDFMRANGTVTLLQAIRPSPQMPHVVVDTASAQSKDEIVEGLQSNGMEPADIGVVVCTHGHSDHIGNLNLFPNAKIIVGFDISQGDLYTFHNFKKDKEFEISSNIHVVPTPGHTTEHVSVTVTNVEKFGNVLIAGDLFECEEDITQDSSLWERNSANVELQSKNRSHIIKNIDWIVPGHGKMFQLTQDHRDKLVT